MLAQRSKADAAADAADGVAPEQKYSSASCSSSRVAQLKRDGEGEGMGEGRVVQDAIEARRGADGREAHGGDAPTECQRLAPDS